MMLSSLSSNVVLAKTRAMFGERLRMQDYNELLGCQSVGEIAAYLKGNTKYADVLAGISEQNVHRGQLEPLLKQKLFNDFALICRYEFSLNEKLSHYMVVNFEIEQILHSLMFLLSGSSGKYLYSMPLFFNKHTHIDLVALSTMKNYDDFLNAISKSHYYEMLKPFKPTDGNRIDLNKIENLLYSVLYKKMFKIIKKSPKFQNHKELSELLNSYINMKNFVRIIRLKKYYAASSSYIRSFLLPCQLMQKKCVEDMLAAQDYNEAIAIMKESRLGNRIDNLKYVYLDDISYKMRYDKSRKIMRFTNDISAILFAYVFLLETEITNIINIIEGVKYKLPNNEIRSLLIFKER